MKNLPLRGYRSAIGMRMMGQFVALALLPVGAVAVLLALQSALTPTTGVALAAIAGAAALTAIAVAVWQSELIVRRLDSLTESTSRIANQDFSITVPVQGNDEVAQLATAINDMARNLDESLAAQQILAQMDDAILTKLDVGALIRSAMRCLRLVTHGEVVVLGLFETDAADTLRVFVIREGERNRIASQKLEIAAELKRRVPLVPTDNSEPLSPFPPDFENRLREEAGVGHFFALPISRGNRAWGMMVSCHRSATRFSERQVKMLNGVANRLIAGFSGAERDQKLHSLAYVDPLTGLPNRVAMHSLLSQELAKATRKKTTMAILFIDLDRFKQANDTHGHAFGDRLLIQASNRIRNNVREDDIVARLGGDEFTVMLPDVKSPREAASVARKLIQSLSRRFEIEGQTIYTGASVGISMFPDDGTDGPELLKMADTAMYRAKSAGRSRFAFFEEPMNAESKRRSVLDGELRNALSRGELVLHYQPQIDLRTGALCGVEALVRWQHPTKGLLFPRDFVEYAEEIGLIPEIGAWVMHEACRQHKRWRDAKVRVPRISVNVSNGQLPRSNFVAKVRHLLETTQMPAGALEIEVTESMLVDGGKPAVEALNQLSADGVLIAIDDFGTGYSSFSYLKTMPAKVLKLDMSFLVDARVDNDAGKIVAAIINMAHALQKEVVAEGIERVDQLKLLKGLGCERGQGYLFGKPVTAEHVAMIFRSDVDPAEEAALEGDALAAGAEPGALAEAQAPQSALAAPGESAGTSAETMELEPAIESETVLFTGEEAEEAESVVDPVMESIVDPVVESVAEARPAPAVPVSGAEAEAPIESETVLMTGEEADFVTEAAGGSLRVGGVVHASDDSAHAGPATVPPAAPLTPTEQVLDRAARDLDAVITEQPVVAADAQIPLPANGAETLDELKNRGEPGTVVMPFSELASFGAETTEQPPDTGGLAGGTPNTRPETIGN